tara:strand:+ start:4657 stop:5118 length:462 start_codon:yes stop_codon:yes gene_type:complete
MIKELVYSTVSILIFVIFLISIRGLLKELIYKYKEETCKNPEYSYVKEESNNIDSSEESNSDRLENEACPKLDDYIHKNDIKNEFIKKSDLENNYIRKSELVPNLFFRTNPFVIKSKCPKCETCTKKDNNIQEIDKNIVENDWIPVPESECIV